MRDSTSSLSDPGLPSGRRGLPLVVKTALLLSSLVLVPAILSDLIFVPRMQRAVEEAVSQRGNSMVGLLAWHQEVRQALLVHDRVAAARVARRVLDADPGVRYVVLLDPDEDVLGAAMSDATAGDVAARSQVARVVADPRPGESFDGETHRFVSTVGWEDEGSSGSGAERMKPLGKIVLGLSGQETNRRLSALAIGLIAVLGGLSFLAALLLLGRTTRRLGRFTRVAERMAHGDLGEPIEAEEDDEIGRLARALEVLRDRLGGLVARVQDAALVLTEASGEIRQSSEVQGQSAARQAQSLAQTGATMAELKETFGQAAARAQSVVELAKKSEESTTSGRAAVQESVQAMEQIRDEVTNISSTILGLVERTNQIAVIIDTVNDLAEQSNVLALNAAIEAARAGEHGKGFAVVAREVRNLAKRSEDSTAQVRSILQDIERASHQAIAVIDVGTRKAQNGMELANRAGQSIVILNRAIDESSTAAMQIAASIRQQSAGMEQIWHAMQDVDQTARQDVAGVQQLAGSADRLLALSEELGALISSYRARR